MATLWTAKCFYILNKQKKELWKAPTTAAGNVEQFNPKFKAVAVIQVVFMKPSSPATHSSGDSVAFDLTNL